MAGYLNKVMLIGNVGKDPEIRSFQNGGSVANLSLATSESWRDKTTGERKERTQWHRIAVFNEGIVKVIEKYVKKGDKLFIEGQLETRKWTDNSGQEKYAIEVVLRPFHGQLTMLSDNRRRGDGGDSDDHGEREPAPGGIKPPREILDDDIPF